MSRSSSLATRLLAVGALLLTSAAFVLIVFANRPEGATASDSSSERLASLRPKAEAVAVAVGELGRGGSTKPVRDRIRTALAETRATAEWAKTTPGLVASERMTNAMARYDEYLDALGSVLANPRSPLRFRLAVFARRARAAFESLPSSGRLETTVRNWERALAFAQRRRARER